MARGKQTCRILKEELRQMEQQLRMRQLMGRAVALAGISAGMIAFSGCGSSSNQTTDDNDTLQGEPSVSLQGVKILDSNEEEHGEEPAVWDVSEVDEKPQFPGGDENMRKFFDECFQKEKDFIIGEATVGYVVTSAGAISNPEIVKGDSDLGAQLIRIIRQFPKYTPGKKNGYPVDVYMTFSHSASLNIGVDTIK